MAFSFPRLEAGTVIQLAFASGNIVLDALTGGWLGILEGAVVLLAAYASGGDTTRSRSSSSD